MLENNISINKIHNEYVDYDSKAIFGFTDLYGMETCSYELKGVK